LFAIGCLIGLFGVCFATLAVAEQAPSAWYTRCEEPTDGGTVCNIEHKTLLKATGQELLRVTVKVDPGSVLPALMIRTPLGLYLPDGVVFKVDDGKTVDLALQTCKAEGCYAGSSMTQDLLAALMSGEGVTVSFKNLTKKDMDIPVSLEGFDAAYREVRFGPDPG